MLPPRRAALVLVAAAASLLLLAWLLGRLAVATAGNFDSTLSSFAIAHRDGALTVAMRIVTEAGSGAVATVVAATALLLLWRRNAMRSALAIVVVIAGELLIEYSAKLLVLRVRPNGHQLVTVSTSGFPSGHAMYAAAFFGILTVLALRQRGRPWWSRPAAIALGVLAALVGISRVYLGVHWPTDVLAGWLLGGAWAALVAHVLVPPRETAQLQ